MLWNAKTTFYNFHVLSFERYGRHLGLNRAWIYCTCTVDVLEHSLACNSNIIRSTCEYESFQVKFFFFFFFWGGGRQMGVYFISYGQFYMEKVDLQTRGNFFQPTTWQWKKSFTFQIGLEENLVHFMFRGKSTISTILWLKGIFVIWLGLESSRRS